MFTPKLSFLYFLLFLPINEKHLSYPLSLTKQNDKSAYHSWSIQRMVITDNLNK